MKFISYRDSKQKMIIEVVCPRRLFSLSRILFDVPFEMHGDFRYSRVSQVAAAENRDESARRAEMTRSRRFDSGSSA